MMIINVPQGYEALGEVLQAAVDQASKGKGKERHSCGEPFDQQMIVWNGMQARNIGFAVGQAVKKATEAQRLPAGADVAELLGAINYLAAAVITAERLRGQELYNKLHGVER